MGATASNQLYDKPKKKKRRNTGDWGGYVDCPMGKHERDNFKKYLNDTKISIADKMQAMADDEINLSFSWSDREDAYIAKATMVNESDNKRYMLSAFHSDVEIAWELLFYKHFNLLESAWFADSVDDDEDGNWG